MTRAVLLVGTSSSKNAVESLGRSPFNTFSKGLEGGRMGACGGGRFPECPIEAHFFGPVIIGVNFTAIGAACE